MSKFKNIDSGLEIDWGFTSDDYAVYRPGPPDSFYKKLADLGVGLKGQKILDLGTGTGVLARRFAEQGSCVAGIDISNEQIAQAKKLAAEAGLNIDFRVSPAETTPFSDHHFDVITANQCWLYFDTEKAIKEVKRLLIHDGLLVTSYFVWLPRIDKIAYESEQLVLKHNPKWNANDYNGQVVPMPEWALRDFDLKAMFAYDEAVPFTRHTWRGRIRACRGVGAALSSEEVQKFDQEHEQLLANIAPENFSVLHKIVAYVMSFKSA